MTIEDRAIDSPRERPANHARQYIESDGAAVDHPAVGSLVLLYTTGRVTGQIHRTPLRFWVVGDDLVVAASAQGADTHPGWYLNLLADPNVWVRRDAVFYEAAAETIDPAERDRVWNEIVVLQTPGMADYQAKTSRSIPLVRLVAKS